jgi:hypothetical protein
MLFSALSTATASQGPADPGVTTTIRYAGPVETSVLIQTGPLTCLVRSLEAFD